MEKNRVALLQGMPIFGGLLEQSLESLIGKSETHNFMPDETLVKQGDPPGEVYILEEGEADVVKTQDGQEYHLCRLSRGDCIGEMSLIDPYSRSATVRAVTRCKAICLKPLDFYHLRQKNLEQFTVLQLNIARELCRRLRAVEERFFVLLADKDCDITV